MPEQERNEEQRFDDFVTLISALYKEVQRIKAERTEQFGLRASDVMGLYHLARSTEPLSNSDLARLCDVDRAAMSRSINRMAADGFVTVDESGYRAPVRITDKGKDVAQKFDAMIQAIVSQAGSSLSNSDRSVLYRSLTSILEELRAV